MTTPVTITVVSTIGAAAPRVFDLKLDVDVHAAGQHRSGETAATGDGRRQLLLGDQVTFRARHFGIRWRMTSRITAYDRPHRFVDEQVRGPFRLLHHEHLFVASGPGTTMMTDRMTIAAPLGPAGALVTRLLLAPYLRRLLRQRAAHLQTLVTAPG